MEDIVVGGIAITGMVLGYKLLSQLIAAFSRKGVEGNGRRGRHRRRGPVPPVPVPEPDESPDELLARAEAMQRRIQTLEEIIASERLERREAS